VNILNKTEIFKMAATRFVEVTDSDKEISEKFVQKY
jgi:hypothetical protein